MKFKDIPGHGQVKDTLRGIADSGHIPHAVMLSGPSGAGKMLLARTYAQYLHCEHPVGGEPCGTCKACREHDALNHPDLHFIYPIAKSKKLGRVISADVADEWTRMLREYPSMPEEKWLEILEAGNSQPYIYVEDAKEIVHADAFPSYSSRYKIFIIWQPEKMRLEAANKLLKVIEEPSDGTLFILVSNNELNVLPTIFSRVQRINVGRLSESEVAGYLQSRYGATAETAAQYAPLCHGSLIRADELGMNEGESEEFLNVYRDVMRAAYGKKVSQLRQLSESTAAFGREKIRRFLDYMARLFRENFLYNLRMPQLISMTDEEEAFSTRFSPFINHLNIEDFLAENDKARRDIERNGNAKVILFDYFILIIILLHRKPKQ